MVPIKGMRTTVIHKSNFSFSTRCQHGGLKIHYLLAVAPAAEEAYRPTLQGEEELAALPKNPTPLSVLQALLPHPHFSGTHAVSF